MDGCGWVWVGVGGCGWVHCLGQPNQFMNRNVVIPLCKNEIIGLDPIFHLKLLLSTDISPLRPAFSYIDRGVIKCITYSIFTKRLKELLNLAGYSPDLYSGHSMQRAGATPLFKLGCNPMVIQAVGD